MILSNSCVLQERYAIQSVLGEVGPFDVNYLAWDIKEEKEVVVREYYPVRLTKRGSDGMLLEVHNAELFEYGLGAYSAEGMLLAKVNHPNVAECQEHFKQNGTVYCVNNFISGASLSAYLQQQNGKLNEEEALPLIEKVLDALQHCHEFNLYHGGVDPKSILVDSKGNPVLLGFQTARFKLARESQSLQDIIKPGFSAPEQTTCETEEGPWWDIYGCAATIFHILTGQELPAAKDNWSSRKVNVALYRDALLSPEMCDVLTIALAFEESERPASIKDFSNMLMQTQKKIPQSLHEGDGSPQYQIRYEPEVSHKEAVWQNGVDVAAAKIKIETEAPPIPVPLIEDNELVESDTPVEKDMSNVIPSNPSQLVQANGQDTPKLETSMSDSNGREKELEALLTKMVKWQQVFVAFILGIVMIAVLGLVSGMFIGSDFFQRSASTTTPAASTTASESAGPVSAEAATSAIASAAVAPAEMEVETPENTNQTPGRTDTQEAGGIQIDDAGEVVNEAPSVEAAPKPVEEKQTAQPKPEPVLQPETKQPEPATEQAENDSPTESEPANVVAPFFTDTDLGVSVEEPETETQADASPEGTPDNKESAANEKESLFNYYRVQGDSLMVQGFETAALQWYRNALKYKEDDTYINGQIEAINRSISRQEQAIKSQDSLEQRLLQVRDENGYFLLPDTPVLIEDEAQFRSQIKYPLAAINGGVSGRVILRYMVDERGQVQDIKVVKGLGWGTEDVVIDLLRKTTFQPATFNGEPVKAWATFTTVFRLNKR